MYPCASHFGSRSSCRARPTAQLRARPQSHGNPHLTLSTCRSAGQISSEHSLANDLVPLPDSTSNDSARHPKIPHLCQANTNRSRKADWSLVSTAATLEMPRTLRYCLSPAVMVVGGMWQPVRGVWGPPSASPEFGSDPECQSPRQARGTFESLLLLRDEDAWRRVEDSHSRCESLQAVVNISPNSIFLYSHFARLVSM